MIVETISEHRSFGGLQGFYRQQSAATGTPMRFAVYQPPQAQQHAVPVLFYLAGLTCTEETFAIKAGAQRAAAQLGLMLVTCDTSPRQTGIPGEADDWEFGSGAGFYLNATEAPWARHFRMYDYVLDELRATVLARFPAAPRQLGIFGHSMGGHGALVLALAQRRPVPLGVGVRADLLAEPLPLGREGFQPLPRRGPRRVGTIRRGGAHQARAVSACSPRSSSIRGWPTNSCRRVSCCRSCSSPPAHRPVSRCACAVTRATATTTISSPPSWRITCAFTRRPWPRPRPEGTAPSVVRLILVPPLAARWLQRA